MPCLFDVYALQFWILTKMPRLCIAFVTCKYFYIQLQVKSVFLDCLPVTWDEARVFELFKRYGDIESVKLACNMPNAKRPDFGFITFSTRDAALACIDDVNKVGVVDRSKKVYLCSC